ncbi:uncharacterized protein LOC105828426 isoform X1 [Monomorium pharaonis]|uniref:uncharacterized protein LOC105828426 isoform X1 n=1 Tax=Monomorium pharaonis TaxID=307658 RepID=UPI001746C39A|nr:uncharacterized protein LOC105828426 isoform X1 [Monomorium pharaonis]
MPDSGAVYQPTTVGYTYDSGGDGSGGGGGVGGGGAAAGLRHGFWRVVARHKLSSRKWLEWTLLSVALCFFVAGLTTMLVSLVSADERDSANNDTASKVKPEGHLTMAPDIQQHVENTGRGSVALGAGIMLVGVLFGCIWAWLTFFHHSKSPRNGMTSSSGQMLGGLNPSTDLLVGSTSQYGPVLTEVPSQMKIKQASAHDMSAIPLSDQEEEMHTLMQDSASPPSVSVGSNTIVNQIPG